MAQVTVEAAGETATVNYSVADPAVLPFWGSPVWREEWDNGIDPAKWNVRNNTSLSIDSAGIFKENATVADGKLTIAGKNESRMSGKPYTTGYLDTIGKFSQKYGRWEIRCSIPTTPNVSRGFWPAFWLRGDNVSGEIDVMEAWGSPYLHPEWVKPNGYTVTVHQDTNHASGTKMISLPVAPPGGVPLSEGFHTYAVEWKPSGIVFLLDGVVTKTITNDPNKTNYENAYPWFDTALNGPFNIRLNMQVGGQQGEPDANSAWPAEYVIDYIRAWALPQG